MNVRTAAALLIGVLALGSAAYAALTKSRDTPDGAAGKAPNAPATESRAANGVAGSKQSKPVLVDSRTVRLPSGKDVSIGPGLTEFRSDDNGVVTRFRREGADREYGWRADPSAPSPEKAVWGASWTAQTEPGVHVGVDASGTMLTLPHGVAKLPLPLGTLIQQGNRFFVSVQTFMADTRNVYCYDDRGRLLWRIGETPPELRAEAYAGINVRADGSLEGLNSRPFRAIVDRETGKILSIKEGPW